MRHAHWVPLYDETTGDFFIAKKSAIINVFHHPYFPRLMHARLRHDPKLYCFMIELLHPDAFPEPAKPQLVAVDGERVR